MPVAPPVRIVHLGLGNFHRAHQAWYTANTPDAADWGIAAFTGRRPDTADDLRPQDGLYTLISRGAEGDTFEVVGSVSAVHPAADHEVYLDYLGRPEVSVVTITVTEAGYVRGPEGRLDMDRPVVRGDLAALQEDHAAPVTSLPGKLVAGLLARRAAGSGAITLLSCDNLPHNGPVTETVVRDLAAAVDETLLSWIDDHVDFATSMVDRITPATIDDDRDLVAASQGYQDASPVPTEPFSEWVMSGRFPSGRPAWQDAGAQIVDDVTPYEQRKLWLLNGSHSLLAYAGSVRGHATVDQAIDDSECRGWVESFWNEASPYLTLPAESVVDYRRALLERYANPRIGYQLSQIATDGSIKLPVRILPTLRAERAAGRLPVGCATAVAAWILHLRGEGAPIKDEGSKAAQAAAGAEDLSAAAAGVLDTLDPGLGADVELVGFVAQQCRRVGDRQ
jgi:fructuronate reductase